MLLFADKTLGRADEILKVKPFVQRHQLDEQGQHGVGIPPLAEEAVVGHQGHGEQVAPGLHQDALQQRDEVLPHVVQQIVDQVLLVGEILVEASPGDVSLCDDPVDGYVGKPDPGQLAPAGVQQPSALLLRQSKKCCGGHGPPPFMTGCRNVTDCHVLYSSPLPLSRQEL